MALAHTPKIHIRRRKYRVLQTALCGQIISEDVHTKLTQRGSQRHRLRLAVHAKSAGIVRRPDRCLACWRWLKPTRKRR